MRSIFRINNIKKTWYYLKKNGLKQTFYAARERAVSEIRDHYTYEPLPESVLERQRAESAALPYQFSIVVPVFHPNPDYFRDMLESVVQQTYSKWELLLADAGAEGETGTEIEAEIEAIIKEYQEKEDRIHYRRLKSNRGISGNSNQALQFTTGDYVCLLDHDDLLTPDALYEMAAAIREGEKKGILIQMLYSDEDKCNEEGTEFFDDHRKQNLNLDLLLSNNYICHFLVMKRELIQTLEFRPSYDGAQDYDIILRAIDVLLGKPARRTGEERMISLRHAKEEVAHVGKVLYHWRTHMGSTADNPRSKEYAYEAGKRAIEDFLRKRGWNGEVSHIRHLGFYRVDYIPDELTLRPEVGVIGGKLLNKKNKITGGIYKSDGTPLYHGLHKEYSGYMHRAGLRQEAEAVDIRCMQVSPAAEEYLEKVIGLPYLKNQKTGRFDWKGGLKEEADYKKISLQFCKAVREAGFVIVWDPHMTERLKY